MKKTVSIILILVVILSTFVPSAFAAEENIDVIDIRAQISKEDVARVMPDEEGYHGWTSLTAALNHYGATFAVYVGIYNDPTFGAYSRYYVQMTGWRIYFGVNDI